MNSQIAKAVRAIRQRGRPCAVLEKRGVLRVHDPDSGMFWRSIEDGWGWVGTYSRSATPEMIAEDLGVVA